MADYAELFNLRNDSALLNRVAIACVVAAGEIRNEPPSTSNHNNRLVWAREAFESPQMVAGKMWMALLAANKDLTVQQIQEAGDAAIQTRVNEVVDLFATGS